MNNIQSFKQINFTEIEKHDDTGRNIGYSILNNTTIVGRNHFYPNVLFHCLGYHDSHIFSPYDEKIMSFNKDSFYDNNIYTGKVCTKSEMIVYDPLFFFIYNFDNYYHFLYDTIPYLHTFFKLKQSIPHLKLLVNYPNPKKNDFYKFNLDLLQKFISREDIFIHQYENHYKTIYISTSLTHGGLSNLPPRKEIFYLYQIDIPREIGFQYDCIYISRRTWINSDTSNIGTNYTTRRKMMNEDSLVEQLSSLGIQEIFSENLSIDEKIHLFRNAKLIIGSIGGGMSNLLFSLETTPSIVIVTPEFLEINYRFKYSMEHTDISYFYNVETYKENNEIPLFTRVEVNDINTICIGEIVEYNEEKNQYLVNLSNNDVAGFNNDLSFKQRYFSREQMKLLDKGLNSPFIIDCNKLIKLVKNKIYNTIYNDI